MPSDGLLLKSYNKLREQRDLWILLAWASILTGILLNTFYQGLETRALDFSIHGSCTGAIPCQTSFDLLLIFAAALGAGMVLESEKVIMLGFLAAHGLATLFFIASLTAPVLLGLADPLLAGTIVNLSFIISFGFQFPIGLILSLSGSVLGAYVGSKL